MWTEAKALFFLAVMAVYSGQATQALAGDGPDSANGGNPPASNVRVYDDRNSTWVLPNPFSAQSTMPATAPANSTNAAGEAGTLASNTPATAPTTAPADAAVIPTDAAHEGKSVSASQVSVKKDAGTVEIHVNDASLVEVLRMLSLQSETNILPSREVHGSITANLYDVTIREALDAILHANGYAYREQGNVIYVYTTKEIADMAKADQKLTTEVFHLYYTPAVNAQTMIKPVLSHDGSCAVTTPALVGITPSSTDAGGNNHAADDLMVVTDYPENLDKVRKILKEVDRRPQQLLVEATILSASLSDNNALGVDFTLLGGVNFAGLTGAGSSATDALSGTILNNPTAGKVTSSGLSAVGTGFTQNVPQSTGALRVGVITNNVAVFISALEEITDTVILANPKVLVLNKQKGEVKVAREDPYRGAITTNTNGTTQQEVDFLETGTSLIFRPFIGDDGYIRLEIHPEDSSPLPSSASDLPPTKLTTETTTNVMCKDGHTIVIGGMFRQTTQVSKNQIPVLGSLPLVGYLFRSQADSSLRQEVIILLTPHIIKDDMAYANLSEKEMKEAERLRVGIRKGMMPFGRDRLAQTCYEEAVAEMNKAKPNRQLALWHLNCALNLSPLFSEAIEMKERLTGMEVSDADSSSIRGFLHRAILSDRAATITAVPTTAPAAEVKAVTAPTTQSAASVAVALPATRPASDSMSAATVPAVRVTTSATQPADSIAASDVKAVTELPCTASSAMPSASADLRVSGDTCGVACGGNTVAATTMPSAAPATAPSTAVRTGDSDGTVTELPMDEIPQGSKSQK